MSTGIEGFSFNLLYLNSVFRVLRLRLSLESLSFRHEIPSGATPARFSSEGNSPISAGIPPAARHSPNRCLEKRSRKLQKARRNRRKKISFPRRRQRWNFPPHDWFQRGLSFFFSRVCLNFHSSVGRTSAYVVYVYRERPPYRRRICINCLCDLLFHTTRRRRREKIKTPTTTEATFFPLFLRESIGCAETPPASHPPPPFLSPGWVLHRYAAPLFGARHP